MTFENKKKNKKGKCQEQEWSTRNYQISKSDTNTSEKIKTRKIGNK